MADVKELNINSTTYDIKAKSVVDNNSGAVKFWTGTSSQLPVTKDSKTQYICTDTGEIYLGDVQIGGGGGASRNIGEIVASTIPLTDAGLHLLDGALISGSGIYSDFVDYIADLYDSGDYTAIFETEANWQSAVTTYGVCGKFVYDSVNNTVRLPKYSNKIYTKDITSTAPVKGNGMTLGITNGSFNAGFQGRGESNALLWVRPELYGTSVGTAGGGGNVFNAQSLGITTDGTKSGIIADLANITTSLEGYYYIVIATSTKTDIEVDIDEVVTDLNGKADVDLTNVNNNGTAKIAHNAMPSNTYVDLTLGASGTEYTAPADGYMLVVKYSGAANEFLYIAPVNEEFAYEWTSNYTGEPIQVTVPWAKGMTYKILYSLSGSTLSLRFIYAEGSKWEAS